MTWKRAFLLLILALVLLGELRRGDEILWHSPACRVRGWHATESDQRTKPPARRI